jgi:cytochrome c2
MPYSLRWIGLLLACAALAAPVSLAVQRLETMKTARASARALTGGDPDRGKTAIARYRCGACHQISGIHGADGGVGPPLKGIATRAELAGHLPNDPASLQRWIRQPQQIAPGNGMPDLGVSEQDGRDIAAYLYTLR